jgi:hypothetical protein
VKIEGIEKFIVEKLEACTVIFKNHYRLCQQVESRLGLEQQFPQKF